MFPGGLGARALQSAGILCGWALQGYLVVGHCKDTLWFGTAGIGRALRGCSAMGAAVRLRAEGEDNIDFQIYQPHCEGGEQTEIFKPAVT